MANLVEIVIKVDNAQAGQALAATQGALQQVGVTGAVSMNQLAQGAAVATPAMQNVGAAALQMGGHITTSLDGVRLMSQEFGFRLPRALEAMLSRMPAVTSAIGTMMGAFAGIAIAEVFVRVGESIYNVWQKYISLSAAAKEYNKEVEKHRDAAFIDPHSIEVTTQRLNEATAAAQRLKTASEGVSFWQNMKESPETALVGLFAARQAADAGYKNQGFSDDLFKKQLDQQHELNRLHIEAGHAGDGALGREQKITAELQKQSQLLAEDQRFRSAEDLDVPSMFGLRAPRGPSASANLQSIADQKEAAAQRIAAFREERNQRIALENEATNSGLTGIALLRSQESQAIAAMEQRFKEGEVSKENARAERAAIEKKFDNEAENRVREIAEQGQKQIRAAQSSGLTGRSKILGDYHDKIMDIHDDSKMDQGSAYYATEAAKIERDQKLKALDSEYTESVRAQIDARTEASLKGFAKIEAEEQRMIDASNRAFGKQYGGTAAPQSALDTHSTDIDSIHSDASAQRLAAREQLQQQELQMATEAAQAERRVRGAGITGWTEDYRHGVAEVQAAEEAMLNRIKQEQAKLGSSPETDALFNKERVDAVQKADAQIEQLNQQMAHQVAGVLQGAFDDPVHYIQNAMKKMMFEILANWITQSQAFSSTFGRLIGNAHPGSTGAASSVEMAQLAAHATGHASGGSLGDFGPSTGTIGQASIMPGYSGTAGSSDALLGNNLQAAGMIGNIGLGLATHQAPDTGIDPQNVSGTIMDPSTGLPSSASGSGASAVSSTLGGIVGAGVGAYTGTKGIIGAFEQGSPGGILNGAMSGAAMGGSIGMLAGPAGAAIGAGIGAAGGAAAGLVGWATGEGGNLGAADYFKKQMKPQMEGVETTYAKGGSGDAMSAISQIDSIAASGMTYMAQKFGASSANWARAAYVSKEQSFLEQQINSMALGGKDYMSRSAAQFHTGGGIDSFNGLDLGGGEGFVKALLGETVANRSASAIHGSEIGMMNAGATTSDMAAHYLKSSMTTAPSSGGNTYHQHDYDIDAVDADSFEKMLTQRGGIQAFRRADNKYSSQYAGDAAYG